MGNGELSENPGGGRLTRREYVKRTAAALALGMTGLLSTRSFAQSEEQALLSGLRDHLRYSAGFRRKFRTGFYSEVGANPSLADAGRALAGIRERLSQLGDGTLALVHALEEDGRLRSSLLDHTGLVATSVSPEPYYGLEYLTWALNIDQRMATRVAIPVTGERPVLVSPPTRDLGTPAGALELARDELIGGEVAAVLGERRGRLLVLPARDTGSAPYPALPLPGGELLTRRFAVTIVPDIETLGTSAMLFQPAEIDWSTPLLVGNPDLSWNPEYRFVSLPHAQEEVAAVQELIGLTEERVHFTGQATLDRVVQQSRGYDGADVIYLASHAVTNRVNPMDGSFVGLAEGNLTGQMLRGDTFDAWSSRHPLVVLSACQTALGRVFDGGAYGMSRVMYAAGAAQVVSSLWSVDDRATRDLMTAFAERLFFGYTAETALQRAQWATMELYPDDPGAWASFCVFGMPSAPA